MQKSRIRAHIRNNTFYNDHNDAHESLLRSGWSFVKSLYNRSARKPQNLAEWVHSQPVVHATHTPVITWIGHATFLIQMNGINIITDPIFGGASFLFPRMLPPGITVEKLPNIDYILLSHNHPDHFDAHSLRLLIEKNPGAKILVPLGDKRWFDKRGYTQAQEFDWWQNITANNITFTFCPAHHWSRRGILDTNKSLWGSWMISGSVHVYFAGDTAYGRHFNQIQEEFGVIHAALMPIGPCEPDDHMRRTHVDAAQAGQAFLELEATHFIPMHWGTFAFGKDSFLDPVNRIKRWWELHVAHEHKKLHILPVGKRLEL